MESGVSCGALTTVHLPYSRLTAGILQPTRPCEQAMWGEQTRPHHGMQQGLPRAVSCCSCCFKLMHSRLVWGSTSECSLQDVSMWPACLSVLAALFWNNHTRTHVHSGHDDIMPLLGDGPGGIAGPGMLPGGEPFLAVLFCSVPCCLSWLKSLLSGRAFLLSTLAWQCLNPASVVTF